MRPCRHLDTRQREIKPGSYFRAACGGLTFSAVRLRLLLPLLLFELHVAEVHDGPDYFVAAVLLVRQEAQDVHGVLRRSRTRHFTAFGENQLNVRSSYIRRHQLLPIIHALHGGHALGAEVVVVRVGGNQQHVCNKEG